jgi:hypothetical protein
MADFVLRAEEYKKRVLNPLIDARMREAGPRAATLAKALCPEHRGSMRASIQWDYDSQKQQLRIYSLDPDAIHIELQERPFLRPALGMIAATWGGSYASPSIQGGFASLGRADEKPMAVNAPRLAKVITVHYVQHGARISQGRPVSLGPYTHTPRPSRRRRS